MMVPVLFDPEQHEIVRHPVRDMVSRETGEENLVVYRHRVLGSWVLAFKEGDWMLEVGFLCEGDENSQHPTREDFQRLVRVLRTYKPKDQYVRELRANGARTFNKHVEDDRRLKEAHHTIYRSILHSYGAMKAEQYLHANHQIDLAKRPVVY